MEGGVEGWRGAGTEGGRKEGREAGREGARAGDVAVGAPQDCRAAPRAPDHGKSAAAFLTPTRKCVSVSP